MKSPVSSDLWDRYFSTTEGNKRQNVFPEREERWKKAILPPESPPPRHSRRHWPFCRGSKSSPIGERLPTQTGLAPLSVGRRPPMWACAGLPEGSLQLERFE
ncbi:hypothetical protein ILYODFUR_011125 [Ilyodon furcidens]|uniref:Uncharacterized protein n=1 Tax=Ilyodon furcidens TaxID=33524 RepID=A0ABV0U7F1_9TELE